MTDPLISEEDALEVLGLYDALPEEKKPEARDFLIRYHHQQDHELGQPLFPGLEKKEEQERDAFYSLFSDLKNVDRQNPMFASVAGSLKDPDLMRKSEASIEFLKRRYSGDSEERIREHRLLYMNAYAAEEWGEEGVLDPVHFFELAKKEVEGEQAERSMEREAGNAGRRAGAQGTGNLKEDMAAWKAWAQNEAGFGPAALEVFAREYDVVNTAKKRNLTWLNEALPALKRVEKGEARPGDREVFNRMAWTLSEMPVRERRAVLLTVLGSEELDIRGMAKNLGESDRRGVAGTFKGSALRVLNEMFGDEADAGWRTEMLFSRLDLTKPQPARKYIQTPQEALEFVEDLILRDRLSKMGGVRRADEDLPAEGAANGRLRELDAAEQILVKQARKRVEKRLEVGRDLKLVAYATDPFDESVWGKMSAVVGSSVGVGMTLALGPVGMVLSGVGYRNMNYNELRRKYPHMTPHHADEISMVSAGAQVLLDRVGVRGLKALPSLARLLTGQMSREMAKRAAWRTTKSFILENVAELFQDYSTPVVQHIANLMRKDIPEVDWELEMEKFWQTRWDVALGMIPLTLLGLGKASVQDFIGMRGMLARNDYLGQAGIPEPDRVRIVDLETRGRTAEAEAAVREAWGRRSPEIARSFQNETKAREIEMGRAWGDAERLGLVPAVTNTPAGWTVTDRTGASVTVASREEAMKLVAHQLGQTEADRFNVIAEAFARISQGGQAPGQQGGLAQSAQSEQAGPSPHLLDAQKVDQVVQAVTLVGMLGGLNEAQARATARAVFGNSESSLSQRMGEMRAALMNGAGGQAGARSVMERQVGEVWAQGLRDGRWTPQEGLSWVRKAEVLLGVKLLDQTDEAALADAEGGAIQDAMAALVIADVVGQTKDGRQIAQGTISQGVMEGGQQANSQTSTPEGVSPGKLEQFLRSWRAYFAEALDQTKAGKTDTIATDADQRFAESADSAARSNVAATPAGTQAQPATRPPAAQEMMGAFPLDPVDNSNLENENEHHGSTRPSEEGARSGRSGQPRLRPQDWQRERPGVDARGAGDAASRSFREVYAGLPAEVSSPVAEAWRQRIAPAEIAAVAAGRKPAFHEYLGDEAAPLAQALGRELPGLHVEAFDGHLVVADLDLVGTIAGTADPAAASAALREAALSDNVGEYLGYGVPHWNEADAIVTLRDASGEMLAGFHTLNEGVEDFARDRAQDYAAYLGPGVTAEIELKRKPQPQSQPKSQPQGQSGDQGQSQDQVPSASQGLSGAPSQAGDPQGAAPAPAGTGNTGLAAPASRERAAQYFEQAFAASSALFQHLGLGIEEIHTEAEAAARGIPAHISVGVSRDGRRLVVVRPRLEPGTTAALAAAITREELIHAAWIAALREQWRRDPQGRTFQDHLRHEEGRILEELELTEAGREALLNTVNIYHGQGRTQTGPLYTSYDQARAAVDGGLSGMVTELARQLIQMREGGRLSEHVFARTMRRLRDWMRKALRGLKKLAARPENASPLLNQAIRDTEAILEGRDISPSPWDAEATEYYGAPSWGDGPPPAMLRLEVPETAPDMAGLFTPTGEGVRGFQGQVAQAAVPALPVVLTGVQPTVLTAAGAPGGAPLAVLPKVFADMDRLKLNPEEKQALLDHLLRPIAVFGPRTPPYSVRVLTPYLEEGRPVLAEVLLHRTRSGAVEHQVSGLVGMELGDVRDFFKKELLYESGVRTALWLDKFGSRLAPQRGMLYSSALSYILSPEKVTEWHQNQKTPLPPELKAGAVFDKVKKHLPRAKDSLPVLDANLAAPALIDQAEQFLRDHPVVDAPGTGRILLAHPEKGSLRTRAEHLVASHAVTDSYKMGPRISKPEKSLSLPAMVQTVADYHLILEHKGARIYVRCYVNGDVHAVFTSADAKNTPHGPVQETLSSQRILKDGLDGAKIIKVRE